VSSDFAHAADDFPRVFALRGGRGAIVLHESGLRHPRTPRLLGEAFTRYEDVTHHTVNLRGLRLGTRRSVHAFPRSAFADPRAPDELARELVDRIARRPGGREQLDRMWAVEKRAARPRPVRAAPALAALCLAVFVTQFWVGGERLFFAGMFSDTLVRAGDWWRVITANLLHGGAVHLLLNGLGLLALGSLIERMLGSARTGVVLGAGALAGMGVGLLAGYEMAVGASGIVFALVGALLWLELREPARLPAPWRVPRAILLGALVADGLLGWMLPAIAGAAHLSGLAAGILVCACVASGALDGRRVGVPVLAVDGLLLFALGAGVAAAGSVALREGSPLAGRAELLAERGDIPPMVLNNLAWLIATDPRASASDRSTAVRLAERAVEGTGRNDPNVLDTLAEAQFAAGSAAEAVATIDEAIALAPQESYFREQRRRFTGERSLEDRPEPPGSWITPERRRPPPERRPEPLRPDDGLRV
jgi:membrane associated rhomboid family serine protease